MSLIYEGEIITTENGTITLSDKFKELVRKRTSEFDCSTIDGQISAYKKCDIVRSVLGKSSSFIANLKIWALNDDGSENKSEEAKREIAKLNRPNPEEDRKVFFKKLDQKCKLHGRAYVRRLKSEILNDEFYYVIPNEYVMEVYKNSTNNQSDREIEYLRISTGVDSYKLYKGEFHIFYDVTCENRNKSFYGASRLESLSEIISTYVTAWEVHTEMFAERGALNVISLGINDPTLMALPQTENEKNKFYDWFKKKFGVRRGQDKNVITSLDAKVSPISAKMSDMEFEQTKKDCKKAVCNAVEIPPELIGVEGSRFKTIPEARKEAYTQSAIPSFEYYISEWLTMRGKTNLPFTISPDASHLDFYQEAQLQKAVAFQQMANAVVPLVDNKIMSVTEARIQLDLE